MMKTKVTISAITLVVMLISFIYLTAYTTTESDGISDAEKQEILDAHNKWRSEVGVSNLEYSEELAQEAQKWANHLAKHGCKLGHSKTVNGENVFWSSASGATATEAVDDWGSEKQYYKKGKKISASNYQKFGHYTQVVWGKTTHVGAGRATCKNGGTIWVCQYSPAGNVVGQKPY